MNVPSPLIRLPLIDSKANDLTGFWQWIELLAADKDHAAMDSLLWPDDTSWDLVKLKHRIATFWGSNNN